MNNNIIKILKDKNYIIPNYIIKNYKKLNVGIDSFILLIYLLNCEEPISFNIKKISDKTGLNKNEIILSIDDLKNKKIIDVKLTEDKDKKLEENIYIDPLYEKIFMNIIDEKQESKEEDVYSNFEEEFGRTLSPIEFELINSWLETYNRDIIIEALKESVLNGVKNLKYIDRILFEWNKNGIKKVEQIQKNKEQYKKQKSEVVEIPDFDWVNDEENI